MDKALLRRVIQRSKSEIFDEIYHGRFTPEQIGGFSDLHDFVDANEFGGLTEDNAGEGMTNEEFNEFANTVQGAIDTWLKAGGHLDPVDL